MRWLLVVSMGFAFGCDDDGGSGGGADAELGVSVDDGGGGGGGEDAEAPADMAPPGPECETNEDCEGIAVCHEARCVECTGDGDCTAGFVCRADACVPGCNDDPGCSAGEICEAGGCVAGCRDADGCDAGELCREQVCVVGCADDDGCDAGTICEGEICVEGCRSDPGCGAGEICEESACVEGCRDDDGCDAAQLCIDDACAARGVRCRAPEDCNAGDTCEAGRCVEGAEACADDRLEPNDMVPSALEAGVHAGLGICPGDVDRYTVGLVVGARLTATLEFDAGRGALAFGHVAMDGVEAGVADGERIVVEVVAERDGGHVLQVAGVDDMVRSAYGLTIEIEAPQMCVDTTVYPDADGDGWGVEGGAMEACLEEDETVEGFANQAGDCQPGDVWGHPGQAEICGDWVDDDCDGADAPCPDSMPAVQVPEWDCVGDPPANVYAVARFPDGGEHFQDGGCFVFFEGLPDEFYVTRRLDRSANDPSCERINGCTCPSLNGWPSYDRRMYAFTLRGTPDDCADISLLDHGGEQQAVSNECRKYLYQMHFYDMPYSFVGVGQAVVDERLRLFPTIEVACVEDRPHRNLPYQTLLTAEVERNAGWVPLD